MKLMKDEEWEWVKRDGLRWLIGIALGVLLFWLLSWWGILLGFVIYLFLGWLPGGAKLRAYLFGEKRQNDDQG